MEESFFETSQKEYKYEPDFDPDKPIDKTNLIYCPVPDADAQERRYIASNLNKVTQFRCRVSGGNLTEDLIDKDAAKFYLVTVGDMIPSFTFIPNSREIIWRLIIRSALVTSIDELFLFKLQQKEETFDERIY